MLIMPITSSILVSVDIEPWFIVTYSAGLISTVLGDVSPAVGPGHGPFEEAFEPAFGVGIGIMMAYTIIAFLGSMKIANSKSME